MRCEENQLTFQALLDVSGGTLVNSWGMGWGKMQKWK
jgi:hypothetical protein